jgi:hypothetical protein
MTQTTALDRDALYYPYIHIQDANWLKATLLCFPSVRRMVPGNYEPDDSRKQPLLSSVDLFSKGATKAEVNLLEKLKGNDPREQCRHFSGIQLRVDTKPSHSVYECSSADTQSDCSAIPTAYAALARGKRLYDFLALLPFVLFSAGVDIRS